MNLVVAGRRVRRFVTRTRHMNSTGLAVYDDKGVS